MPRLPRLRIADLPLHVIQRGNNRSACFFAEDDYRFYLHHLAELAGKAGCAVHAFVLMTNHVHLLVTPAKPDAASRLMKRLGQRYVQYVNKTYRRSGTLWEGRFRSCLAQSEPTCWPAIAISNSTPCAPAWSPIRATTAGAATAQRRRRGFRLITPHREYLRWEPSRGAARDLPGAVPHRARSRGITAIRTAVNGGYALGDERFREEIEAAVGRRVTRGRTGRPPAATDPVPEEQAELF